VIRVERGDITALDVDAVVTAANRHLAGGGGVDGAIHRAAGPELLEACRELGGCPTGEARATPGFGLKARWCIHAVGPIWRDGGYGEAEALSGAWRHSLALAAQRRCERIAFPAVSCGVYGFPVEEACRISVETVRSWQDEHAAPGEVLLCAFDDAVAEAWQRHIG